MRPRVKLMGDHSRYHCGCSAVWSVIVDWTQRHDLTLADGDDYDVLIVNGEGSMHHGRPTFHTKMQAIQSAIEQGKRAYLVNTVWQTNPNNYDAILAKLDGVFTREALSSAELQQRHNRSSTRSLDLSYFATIDSEATHTNFQGATVRTDFLDHTTGTFTEFAQPALQRYSLISLKEQSWSSLVRSLKTSSLLVTGRHHAVYAACKARVPFIAIEGNSHKISGLILSADVDIPVAKAQAQLDDLLAWAQRNSARYEQLFDWMEEQAQRGVDGRALPEL